MIRVVTLNLAGLEKSWFAGRAERLSRGLVALKPDVVALQEVGIRGGADFYHQVARIGTQLGLTVSAFVPYGNPEELLSNEQGGVAILSRWPLQTVEERRLPPGLRPPDNRTALMVAVSHPDGMFQVANTHLSWRPEEVALRLEQVVTILDRAQDEGWMRHPRRFVLLGDLNATEEEPAIELLKRHMTDAYRQFHPADPGYTWVRSNPYSGGYPGRDRRLDYIFVTRQTRVLGSGLALNHRVDVASDHYAVWADLSWSSADDSVSA